MIPELTGINPDVSIIIVLLPQPLGPRIEMNSPRRAAKDTSSTTCTRLAPSPKNLVTCSNLISVSAASTRGAGLAVMLSGGGDECVREIPIRAVALLHADVLDQSLFGQDPILAGHHADGLAGSALRMQEGEGAFQHRQGGPHENFLTGVHLSEDVDGLLRIGSGPFERFANGSGQFLHRLGILVEIFGAGDEGNAGNGYAVIGIVERLNSDACRLDDRHRLKAEGDDRVASS